MILAKTAFAGGFCLPSEAFLTRVALLAGRSFSEVGAKWVAKLGLLKNFGTMLSMRYFDKTFFKFTLGFLGIVCVSLVLIYLASNWATP